MRNAEHHALTTSYGTPTWYDIARLSQYWKDQFANAKARPGAAGNPGKVMAELTFGFWIDMLQYGNHRSLWVGRKLNKAFPNARLQMGVIHQRLKAVQLLRNRISHHEPVLISSNRLYNGAATLLALPEVLECVEWVCADTARWMKVNFRYANAERILRDVAAMGISHNVFTLLQPARYLSQRGFLGYTEHSE